MNTVSKRNLFSLLLVLTAIVLSKNARSQTTSICIPHGGPVVIDGNITPLEWDDADSIQIVVSASQKVTVKFKHDSLHLYLAYLKNLESAFRFPEVMLDVNNDKSTSWLSDDWWLHVSASDCESQGVPSNYSNCQGIQPGWEAVPNMVSGPPFTDTIEIKIPFIKVGINLFSNDTVGIAFDVTNTSSIWNYWPITANINNPSTWANAVFCSPSTGVDDLVIVKDIAIHPNPFSRTTTLKTDEFFNNADLTVYNSYGQAVKSMENLTGKSITIHRENLSSGLYFIRINQGGKSFSAAKLLIVD